MSSSHTINIQAVILVPPVLRTDPLVLRDYIITAFYGISSREVFRTLDLTALSLEIENYHAAAYSNIAGYTLLIEAEACGTQLYDHFLNLGEEIDLIWSTPWNAGKILYYATKYPAFLDGAFLLYCTTPSTCMKYPS
ncbi:hypothetical protein BU17DRAFT_60279 [Hysterangium stoloniferum]|nr:hypothetical protein BU17DRAFT_60279 [Hysterangium stoloniferum]